MMMMRRGALMRRASPPLQQQRLFRRSTLVVRAQQQQRQQQQQQQQTTGAAAESFVNHYMVLEIAPDATADEIKAAYRRKAKKTHPDVGGDGGDAAFVAVRRAFETLSDAALRAQHDAALGVAGGHGSSDPRFARFNRWRSEVVPELRSQLGIWSDEVAALLRDEAAQFAAALSAAQRACEDAAEALDAWRTAREGAGGGPAAVGGAGAARFAATGADEGGGGGAMDSVGSSSSSSSSSSSVNISGSSNGALEDWPLSASSSQGSRAAQPCASWDEDAGSGGGELASVEERQRYHRARHAARAAAEASAAAAAASGAAARAAFAALKTRLLPDLRAAAGYGHAVVERQYNKRLEQVAARYRAYGEVVWYDIWEEYADAWLASSAVARDAQLEEARQVEVVAAALLADAEAAGLGLAE